MPTTLQELAQRLDLTGLVQHHLSTITDLVLIPHLFLHQIPFTALPLTEDLLWGDQFRIRYVPSTLIWQTCHNRNHPRNSSRNQPTTTTLGIVENTTGDLPYTPIECELVARHWQVAPEHRLQGSQATPQTYHQLLGQIQALLSSHHAQSRVDDPLASHLLLDNDEKITLRDLLSPTWRFPNLVEVFLSCCETGLSFAAYRVEDGDLNPERLDDPLSLGTGFLVAGARSVISTHWAVSDHATTLFSITYHAARKTEPDRLTALHQAQAALRHHSQAQWCQWLSHQGHALDQQYRAARAAQDWASAEKLKHMRNDLGSLKSYLEQHHAPQDQPFAKLEYWAAFHCNGLID
jgi:CHAT domain-containing protein